MPSAQKYSAVTLASAQVAQPSAHSHQPVRSGALTILITVVVLSLSVLSVLSVSTARADLALTTRQMQSAQQAAMLEDKAQQWLMQTADAVKSGKIESALPKGTEILPDGTISSVIEENGSSVSIVIRLDGSKQGYEILSWKHKRSWQANEELNVWNG